MVITLMFTYLPLLDLSVYSADEINIDSITPDRVSTGNGKIVTITGSGFGNTKEDITLTIICEGKAPQSVDNTNIISIKDAEMIISIPNTNELGASGFTGQAYLSVEREGWGSDSIQFEYINDPVINKIVTNTEIKIERDQDGNIIKNPDGTSRRTKETYLELYGYYFNIAGQQDNVEDHIELKNANSTMSAQVVYQREGYIKAKLPENFVYGDTYDVTVTNKFGGSAVTTQEITLAGHDITQLSKLKVNIGDTLTIYGTQFPSEDYIKVYIGDENGEKEAVVHSNSPTEIKITVPQVATTDYQNVKIVDERGTYSTAITLIDELEVLPSPTPFTVSAVTPDAGTKQGGTEVRIVGTNLTPDMVVMFGDKEATGVEMDEEMTKDGTTVLKAITPPSNNIGSVDVTVINPIDNGEVVLENGFRYTEVENSLVVIDINPTEGYETGGETVTITGLNFQRTRENESGDIVTDENGVILSEDNKTMTFESEVIPNYPKPGTDERVDVVRVRTLKVYFGGQLAEVKLINDDGSLDLEDVTIINPDTGQQVIMVKTPQISVKPREDTPVDVSVEIVTKYIDESTYDNGNSDDDIVIDQYVEKETAIRQYIYKPVPSSPELMVVYEQKLNGIPLIDDTITMANGPADSTLYIYGLDFRPDAKVYFFKEGQKPINELLIPQNEGQVVSVDTLEGSMNGKTINRIEVVTPDINELGPVTVLVENPDGGRTKTLEEFISEGGHTDKEIEVRQFEYLSTPVIEEVTPDFGSTSYEEDGEVIEQYPIVVVKGNMFLVEGETDSEGKTIINKPTVYVIPESVTTAEIQNAHYNDPESVSHYRGEVIEVTKESEGRLVKLDGVKDRLGTRMIVKMPSVAPENGGYRDIIVINPDSGIGRIEDAFEYRQPESRPEIISIEPDKGNVEGGEQVVITGKDFDYDPKEILVTVTINGEIAEIEKVERTVSGADNTVEVTIITPRGTTGEKTVQVINQDGGTAEGKYTYTRVYTNPVITTIAPDHGGPLTEVLIKGDDFILPNPNSEDDDEKRGTRVFFNEYEIQTNVVDQEGTVIEDVYIIDKNTIRVIVPDGLPLGLKDVTVVNPDTGRITVEDGFNYLKPQSNPQITSISPDEGSRDGGTIVTIEGSGFLDDIEVYFGEKKGINPIVNGDGTKIFVTTPSYEVDEKITDRVVVPVTIVNYDGGSDTRRNGFTFRVPGSYPQIDNIDPSEGSTAGFETITIIGKDFRYSDLNSNGKWDEGEPVPKVYFNGIEALDVQYSSHSVLIVKTPPYLEPEKVDVIVVNPDAGTFILSGGFQYKRSTPKINSITPDAVSKAGGTEITILGEDFINSNIYEEGEDTQQPDPSGPIYGEDIDVEVIFGDENNYAPIIGGHAIVEVGNLQVEYDNRDPSSEDNIFVRFDGEDKTSFNIKEGQSRIILLSTGEMVQNLEGIKIEVKDSKLLVTRRLSPKVEYIDENTLEAITPPMSTVGEKAVKVVNRDGGTGQGVIIIKNPNSQPAITDIEPKIPVYKKDSDEVDYYVVESTLDGGLTFTIYGSDFRKNVRVMIGSQEAEVISRSNEDDKIVVKSPQGRDIDINKPLRIVVINEDGGTADSSLKEGIPIYYIYRPRESNPVIDEITPNQGSAKGGERVTITGNDFRIEDITVRIGASEATVILEESSYKKLVVITPPSEILGPVDVFIRNNSALGEVILENGFTYYSNPTIKHITPNEVHYTGGQKVTIRGILFMEGIKVYIDDEEVSEVVFIDDTTIEITTPAGELGYKDVKIENPDGGTYTLKNGLEYILPIPETPTGFRAYPGHERSIVLKWNETEGAVRYKIFGREKGEDDYKFIAETTDLEYYLKDLEEDTRYYFRLWALNEYGESQGYDYAYTTTLEEDEDEGNDKYEIEENNEAVISYSNGEIKVDLPSEYIPREYNLDLTDTRYKNFDSIQISIPLSAMNKVNGSVTLRTKDIICYIPIYRLSTSVYYYNTKPKDDANIIVKISRLDKAEKSRITKNLSRKEEVVTDGFNVEFSLQVSRENSPLELLEGINLGILVDSEGLDEDNLYLAKYNPELNKLDEFSSDISTMFDYENAREIYNVYGDIDKQGKFIVIYRK